LRKKRSVLKKHFRSSMQRRPMIMRLIFEVQAVPGLTVADWR
jgi:hypothetical protein